MPTRYPIFIVDAASVLLQAYKKPVSKTIKNPAVYTFCKTLIDLEQKFNFAHIAIIWDGLSDAKAATVYKNDKKLIMEYVDLMRMEQILEKDISAFDVIFSMMKSFNHQHHDIVIVTTNKNMATLINDATKTFDPFKKTLLDKKPQSTAKESLEGNKHPNPTTAARTKFADKNWQLGLPFFEKYNYKTLIDTLQVKPAQQHSLLQLMSKSYKPGFTLSIITTKKELKALADEIKKSKIVCINVQGTDIDPMASACGGISIALNDKEVYFIPRQHNEEEDSVLLSDVVASLKPVFADKNIEKVMHNAKYNQIILEQNGMPLQGKIFDATIAASLIMHNEKEDSLELLRDFYIKNAMLSYQEMTSDEKASDEPVSIKKELWNSIADTHQTMALKNVLAAELEKEQMTKLFETIEMPTNNVLASMEIAGISCDAALLKKMNVRVTEDIKKLEIEINAYSPTPINIHSVPQVRKLLFDTLKLPMQKKLHKSETLEQRRQASTDAESLIALSKLHPIADLILQYRELFKCKNSYLDTLPQFINKTTHKIHAYWEQSLELTDRISCSHPNLQSIVTHDFGHKTFVRSAFIAQENHTFIAADYHDIALHVVAHLSQDKALQSDLAKKDDMHTKTASHIFATTPGNVTPEQLSIAKKINTSIAYGLTTYGLASDQHISMQQAEFAIEMFFEQYPGVQTWMEKIVQDGQKTLYVTTLFGKRRFIPNLQSKNRVLLDAAGRLAINAIVQGSATEIMKIAMIAIHENFAAKKLEAAIVVNLHDQLVLTCANSDLEKAKKIVQESMVSAVAWEQPLQVTIITGNNWQDVTIV